MPTLLFTVCAVALLGASPKAPAPPAQRPADAVGRLLGGLPAGQWQPLGEGVEYTRFEVEKRPRYGDGVLHVVRMDPMKARLDLALASQQGALRTAGDQAARQRFAAAINAGMYDTDYRSNVGYLKHAAHLNNGRWRTDYQSVLAFGPADASLPSAVLLDRDAPDFEARLEPYASVVQNLRLIRGEGTSVWKPNGREWTEAAVATDRQGRILLLFCRTPMQMSVFNARVLALPLGVTKAMHVEGGPEASLSVRGPGGAFDLSGSYETGFFESDDNAAQWRLPNVLGVRPGR